MKNIGLCVFLCAASSALFPATVETVLLVPSKNSSPPLPLKSCIADRGTLLARRERKVHVEDAKRCLINFFAENQYAPNQHALKDQNRQILLDFLSQNPFLVNHVWIDRWGEAFCPLERAISGVDIQIGRASCRERVCQYV